MTDTTQPADRAGLRDRIRRAVCEAEGFAWDSDMLEPDEYGEVADAVLAVLAEPVAADPPHVRAARYAAAGNEMAASLVRDGFGDDEIAAMLDAPVLPATVDRAAKAEALLLHFAAEAHRRKWAYDRGLDDDGVPIKSEAFDTLHRLGEEMRTALEKLRRVADETPQPEARPALTEWVVATLWRDGDWRSYYPARNTRDEAHREYEDAVQRDGEHAYRLMRATTAYAVEAEHAPAVGAQQPKEADGSRTVCVCGHTRGEHLVIGGRLLCDVCVPDSTENLVCKEFEAL